MEQEFLHRSWYLLASVVFQCPFALHLIGFFAEAGFPSAAMDFYLEISLIFSLKIDPVHVLVS